jgi:YHYH protein
MTIVSNGNYVSSRLCCMRNENITKLPVSRGKNAAFIACSLAFAVFSGNMAYAEDAISTLDGIKAAKWGKNIEITIGEDSFRYVSQGLPNHEMPDQYVVPKGNNQPPFGKDDDTQFEVVNTKDFVQETPIDVTITMHPVYSEKPTQTDLGMIGVIISGARLFNDYENPQRTVVAIDDQHRIGNAAFLDDCNAHPLQSGHGYHYHGVPECIKNAGAAGHHSPIIGVLLDGFPVYGKKGPDGKIMTNQDLDECSGHMGPTPEFPKGIYHYHLTSDKAPYSIDCYHGDVSKVTFERGDPPGGGQGGPPGGPPDFAAIAKKLGISEDKLMEALGPPPPNLEDTAAKLGISVDTLRDALGPPPPPPGQ